MSYLTDRELLDRFNFYTLQLESLLLQGESFKSVVEKVPFAVHLNNSETLQIMNSNIKLTEVTGFHEHEVQEMGMEYLENYLHPTTLNNISTFLPPLYKSMQSHETFPFVQYVKLHNDKDFSPFITFTKKTSYSNNKVICLSLEPHQFGKMSSKMEQLVEMDRFKLKHFRKFQQLTSREVDILTLLANGKNNPQIAQLLFLSRNTIETHRKNIKRKLGLRSLRDLMKYAIAFNLVEI